MCWIIDCYIIDRYNNFSSWTMEYIDCSAYSISRNYILQNPTIFFSYSHSPMKSKRLRIFKYFWISRDFKKEWSSITCSKFSSCNNSCYLSCAISNSNSLKYIKTITSISSCPTERPPVLIPESMFLIHELHSYL